MWVTYGWHITPHYFILQDTLLNLLIMQGHSRYINTYGTHNYRKCIYKCINIISHVYILFFSNPFFNGFFQDFSKASPNGSNSLRSPPQSLRNGRPAGAKNGGRFRYGEKTWFDSFGVFPGKKPAIFYFKLQYLLIISKSYLFFLFGNFLKLYDLTYIQYLILSESYPIVFFWKWYPVVIL